MKENYLEALKWYGKAADMGNAEAKYKLGKILLEEGKRYLQESREQGNVDASEFIKENLKEGNIDENESGDYIVFKSPKEFYLSADKRWDGVIEYSLDKINWYEWSGNGITSDTIYMRGSGNTVITGGSEWHFQTEDRLVCRGNIEKLLDYELCSRGEHPPMGKECYKSMFKGCTSLEEAPALPARELALECYEEMFSECTSLVEAPALPAMELADSCYNGMFSGCISLKEAPALPATKLPISLSFYKGCYASMFKGCISLSKAPALPATELADGCYCKMFKDCTSLKEAPALPAMELDCYCSSLMFKGCTSLKDRSNLPKYCFE